MRKLVHHPVRFNINLAVLAEHPQGLAVQAGIGPLGVLNALAQIIAPAENAGQVQHAPLSRPRRVLVLTAPAQELGLAPPVPAGAIPTAHVSAIAVIR